MKKNLMMILAAVATSAILPFSAWGDGNVAMLAGTETYFSATDFATAFTDGGNPEAKQVIMLGDVSADVTVAKHVSLYLNGYTITGKMTINANLTIYNKLSSTSGNPNSDVGKIQNTGLDGQYPIHHLGGNVYIGQSGNVEITATGANGTALFVAGNKVFVADGAIINGNVETRLTDENLAILNITGGVVNGTITRGANTSLSISGGSFSNDPSAFLTAGYSSAFNSGTGRYDVRAASAAELLATFDMDTDGYYLLKTPNDVKNFRIWNNLTQASGNFRLANDIDMENEELPESGADGKRYYGTFDGNNHKISNVNIKGSDRVAFISTTQNATIKDLTLENVTVVGGANSAAIVGYMRSGTKITNCKVIGNISISGSNQVGAIAGWGYGGSTTEITDCAVQGNAGSSITGSGFRVGGIVGCAPNGCAAITGNSVSGISVTAARGYVGGIAGDVLAGSVAEINVSNNTVENAIIASTTSDYSDKCGMVVGNGGAATATSQIFYENNSVSGTTLTVNGVPRNDLYNDEAYASEYAHTPNKPVVNSVQSVNLFGAVKVEGVASNMFVAVPFDGFDGGARKAKDVVHPVGLANDTKMYVYDPSQDKYDVFKTSAGAWTQASKVTIGATGAASVDNPSLEREVKSGSGVIVERKDKSQALYLYGQIPTNTSVTITTESALVSVPSTNALKAVDLNALDWTGVTSSTCNTAGTRLSSNGGKDMIKFRSPDGKTVSYYYFGGKWGPNYRPKTWDRKAMVPAGTAFWYTQKSNSVTTVTVKW